MDLKSIYDAMSKWMNKEVEASPYRLATFGGIVIATVVSIAVNIISYWLSGFDIEGIDALNQLLAGPPIVITAVMFAVVIVSPIAEELIFRQLLWWYFSLMFSQTTTLITTSLLFVAFHGNLFHAIGLLPISFFFGWLRMRTGSIKHCTVAHVANNAAAASFFFI